MDSRDMPDLERFHAAFDFINGFIDNRILPPLKELSQEEMEIVFLDEQIYQHRLNLCTHWNVDFEASELLEMIRCYEQLVSTCSMIMYNCGWYDGKHSPYDDGEAAVEVNVEYDPEELYASDEDEE